MPLYALDNRGSGMSEQAPDVVLPPGAKMASFTLTRYFSGWTSSHHTFYVFTENFLSGLPRSLAGPCILVPAAAPKPKAPPSRGKDNNSPATLAYCTISLATSDTLTLYAIVAAAEPKALAENPISFSS